MDKTVARDGLFFFTGSCNAFCSWTVLLEDPDAALVSDWCTTQHSMPLHVLLRPFRPLSREFLVYLRAAPKLPQTLFSSNDRNHRLFRSGQVLSSSEAAAVPAVLSKS